MSMASCSRDTCGAPAVAGITYDSGSLSVWVVELHADTGHMMWLCQKHVQTLRAPQDWTVSDERDGTPRLWTVTPDDVSAPSRKRSRVRRQRAQSGRILEVEELQLFELDDSPREAIASVASLDAARNSPRPRSRSALTGEVSPATLLG
ncbi:MAG: DUF3499 family protein [Acidimicrobiales bacterium]|nr:DUF3499 family protein [Acidimicrobiales bacterium]